MTCISIHAAREGGDQPLFLLRWVSNISIHAAREGGDRVQKYLHRLIAISIHAAREGGDLRVPLFTTLNKLFQSTPPVKAATDDYVVHLHCLPISIHAAREGGDGSGSARAAARSDFNPRRP